MLRGCTEGIILVCAAALMSDTPDLERPPSPDHWRASNSGRTPRERHSRVLELALSLLYVGLGLTQVLAEVIHLSRLCRKTREASMSDTPRTNARHPEAWRGVASCVFHDHCPASVSQEIVAVRRGGGVAYVAVLHVLHAADLA